MLHWESLGRRYKERLGWFAPWSHVSWEELFRWYDRRMALPASAGHTSRRTDITRDLVGEVSASSLPVLLVSRCLLGEAVLYTGGCCRLRPGTPSHFLLRFLCSTSSSSAVTSSYSKPNLFTLLPVCPEVELLQLPIPRPPVYMQKDELSAATTSLYLRQALQPESDSSQHLYSWSGETSLSKEVAAGRLGSATTLLHQALLRCETIHGAVLKARSPSCGVGDARLYTTALPPVKEERGEQRISPHSGPAYERVHGFFTQLLSQAESPGTSAAVSLPVTSEKLLRSFAGPELRSTSHPARLSGTLLDFLDDVTRHYADRVQRSPSKSPEND